MKIDFSNMPAGDHKTTFAIKYVLNILRTWYLFHLKFPWVKYSGFVRVMPHTRFAKRKYNWVDMSNLESIVVLRPI